MIQQQIPVGFFSATSVASATAILTRMIGRTAYNEASFVKMLVSIVDRVHPEIRRRLARLKRKHERMSDAKKVRAGFLLHAIEESFDDCQRRAAVSVLGQINCEEARNAFLRVVLSGKLGTQNAIIATGRVPVFAGSLLETYRAAGNESACAGATLIAGIASCDAVIRDEIQAAVQLRVVDRAARRKRSKYSRLPENGRRYYLISALLRIVQPVREQDEEAKVVAAIAKAAIGEFFLDRLLRMFEDDGSVSPEAVRLVMEWREDPRVLSTLTQYLWDWGGTFHSQDVVREIFWQLQDSRCPPPSPKLIEVARELMKRDLNEGIGAHSAGEVRLSVLRWFLAKGIAPGQIRD